MRHWSLVSEEMFKVSCKDTYGKLVTAPGGYVLVDQIHFSYFAEGHLVTFSAKFVFNPDHWLFQVIT